MIHKAPRQCQGSLNTSIGQSSIHLLNSWATCTTPWGTPHTASRHASLRHASSATSGLVHFHHDGVDHALQLLLFGLELILLGKLILVQPIQCLLHSILDLLLIPSLKFIFELLLLQCVAHGKAIILPPATF